MASPYTAPYPTAVPIVASQHLDLTVSVSNFLTGTYDSAADHTAWINNAIFRVGSQFGGAAIGLLFPHPVYNVSDTIDIGFPHLSLLGRGQGQRLSTLAATRANAPTRIAASATFPTTKPVVKFEPPDGGLRLTGNQLSRLAIDGGNRATQALVIKSCINMLLTDFQLFGAVNEQLWCGLSTRTLGDVNSPQFITFQRGTTHNLQGAAVGALAARFTGKSDAPTGNCNNFTFITNRWNAEDGDCVLYENTDSFRSFSEGMSSRLNPISHFGLTIGSADQDSISTTTKGAARYHSFHGLYSVGILLKAAQTGRPSPSHIMFMDLLQSNNGGKITAEIPAGGSPAAHAVAYDTDGVRIYGGETIPYQMSGTIVRSDGLKDIIVALGLGLNLNLCLDAGDYDSYPSAAVFWADVSGHLNHFNRGLTSLPEASDPTFNGISGRKSANEFFSTTGANFFRPASTPDFGDTIHQDNAKFTVLAIYRPGAAAVHRLWSTINATASGTGAVVSFTAAGVMQYQVRNAGAVVLTQNLGVPVTTGLSMVILSVDEAAGAGGSFGRINGDVTTFNATYSLPSAAAADGTFTLWCAPNGLTGMAPAGSQLAAFAFWKGAALTTDQSALLLSALARRFPTIQ
jgi:hypothetical protein